MHVRWQAIVYVLLFKCDYSSAKSRANVVRVSLWDAETSDRLEIA